MGGEHLEGGGHYRGLQSVGWVPRRACECFNVVSRGGTHYWGGGRSTDARLVEIAGQEASGEGGGWGWVAACCLQPGFMVDMISFMVNAAFQHQAHSAVRKTPNLLPQKSPAALRVLGDHLHCDGLHLWVLLQAVLPSGNRQQENVTHAQTVYAVTGQHADAKNCIILLDKDLWGLKQFSKVSSQNTESLLAIFSGQETKSYSQFTSVARHFISSKWTLRAQSIEAVYPGKYTKHWSSFCM